MTVVLQPKTAVTIVGANTTVSNALQKILFIGQVNGGSASNFELLQNIGNDDTILANLVGADSMLGGMIRSARKINKVTQFDAIALEDNASGVAATGTIAVTGTSTEAGTLIIIIGSDRDFKFNVAIPNGSDADTVGGLIETAINANPNVPVTAANSSGTVTMTAVNDGTLGNQIGLAVTSTVAGITTSITGMASGATDPVLTNVFNAIGDTRYQAIVWPYANDVSVLTGFLDARFNTTNRVLDGVGFTAIADSHANHLTRLNALNSQSLVEISDKMIAETNHAGPSQLELPQVKAAQLAAIRALRLTPNESISQYVISSNGALDSLGGPALASKPYFNTPMALLPLINVGDGWTDQEIEQLHEAGGMVIGNNTSGTGVVTGEVVTTYKTDSAGNSDISFKYLNYVDTISGIREYFFNNLRSRFAQSRLTNGDVIKGRDQANALVIQAECERLYQDLSGPAFVLAEAGEEAVVFFKNSLSVLIDKAQGSATIQMTVPIVTQLRDLLATMQLAFSTEA